MRFSVSIEGNDIRHPVRARDLTFTKTDRGGFTSADLTIPQEINSRDLSLAPGSKLRVEDHAAQVIFEGYLDLPGKTRTRIDGDEWKVGVLGSSAILSDKTAPYISIETLLEGFYRRRRFSASATADISESPDGVVDNAVIIAAPGGSVFGNGIVAGMTYERIWLSGQQIGGFAAKRVSGKNDTGWNVMQTISAADGTPTAVDLVDNNLSTTASTGAPNVVPTDFAAGMDTLRFALKRDGGATTVADDLTWTALYDFYIQAQRLSADGVLLGGTTYSNAYVFAHQVIIDAAQRLTSLLDVANADIDTTFTHHIDQLAYPDGTTLSDLLSDLALLEPDLTWGVFESGPTGTHRFKVGRYGSAVRYVVTTADGWEQPGGELSLTNELTVYYTDVRGRSQAVPVTAAVPELDQWGRVRSADRVDLGTEIGSAAAATQVANGILEQANTFPFAGTLTVARPILDQLTGRVVRPYEIEPGCLVQVSDLTDAPPLRLTEMTYTDSSESSALTLGTPTFSTDELVAKLARRRFRKGGKPVAPAFV
jgi:hypothetical protein